MSSREVTTDELLAGKTQEDIDREEAVLEEAVSGAAESQGSNSIPQSLDEGFEIQNSLEVGGVIQDSHGNTWAVPSDNVEDYDDLHPEDPYGKISEKVREVFDLVGVPTKDLRDWMGQGYAPVYQDELQIPEQMKRFTGAATDSLHTIGDLTLMKIPKVINAKRQEAKHRETKRRLAAVEPTAEMREKANKSGVMTAISRKISQDVVDPGNRKGITADDKGNF